MTQTEQNSDETRISSAKEHARLIRDEKYQSPNLAAPPANDKVSSLQSKFPNVQEVARHVISSVPIVEAESPPPPPPPSNYKSSSERRSDKDKKKQREGGNGEDSESNSDEERRRRANTNSGDGVARRRHPRKDIPKDHTAGPPTLKATYRDELSPDELERIKSLRNLRAIEARWDITKQTRMKNQNERRKREWILVDSLDECSRDSAKMNEVKLSEIEQSDEATQNYLHRAILWRSSEHQDQEAKELLEVAIGMFEQSIQRKCYKYEPEWYGEFSDHPRRPSNPQRFLLDLVDRFESSWREGNDLLPEKKFERLMEGCKPSHFTRAEARYLVYLFEEPNFYKSGVFGEETQLAALSSLFKEGTLRSELKLSFDQGYPTEGYKKIVGELVGNSLTKYRQVAIQESMRFVKAAKLDDDAFEKIVKGDITQEFLQDGGVVSAVLFKYQRPFSIATVVHDDLDAMGWSNREDGFFVTGERYSRYQRGCCPRTKCFVFKMDMDGEVMGIWTPRGEISWDSSLTT